MGRRDRKGAASCELPCQDEAGVAAARDMRRLDDVEAAIEIPRHLPQRAFGRVQRETVITPRARPCDGIGDQRSPDTFTLPGRIDRQLVHARGGGIAIGRDAGVAVNGFQGDRSDDLASTDRDEAFASLDALSGSRHGLAGALAFDASERKLAESSMQQLRQFFE